MTYAALRRPAGSQRFADEARLEGATSLTVADIPVDVHPEVRRIQLIAPTTPTERIQRAAAQTDGRLYLVSLTGTPRMQADLSPQLSPALPPAEAEPRSLSSRQTTWRR